MGAPLVVLAFLANMNFLRDPLPVRLPDAIVPAVLVAAWLAGRALRVPSMPLRSIGLTAAAALMFVAASSVVVVGRTQENLARTNLSLGLSSLPQLVRDRTAQLKARYDRQQLPDGRILSLVGLFDYLDRCTTPSHRLLVAATRRKFTSTRSARLPPATAPFSRATTNPRPNSSRCSIAYGSR
jgi:hypothetical protein